MLESSYILKFSIQRDNGDGKKVLIEFFVSKEFVIALGGFIAFLMH